MVYKVHQCLEQMSIFGGNSDKTCNLCKSKKTKKDCCKVHFKVLKTDTAQNSDFLKIDVLKYASMLPKVYYFNPSRKILSANNSLVRINAPPNLKEIALFIRDRNFRI